MNNKKVEQILNDCHSEINNIGKIIKRLGVFDNVIPYLTKYVLIKACGTIEQSYKTIIADCCEKDQSPQVRNYIQSKFRESSRNPSLTNIHNSLLEFDQNRNNEFKSRLRRRRNVVKLRTSLKSLNDARNDFAHGGNPLISFKSICDYYDDALIIVKILDSVVVLD